MKEFFIKILEFTFDVYDACIFWVANMLTFNLDNSVLSEAAAMAEKINDNVVKPVAISIITICFLISFIKILNKEDIVRIETYAKIFFLMCFSKSAVNYSFNLCKRIYNVGAQMIQDAVTDYFREYITTQSDTFADNENKISAALDGISVLGWIVVLSVSTFFILGILISFFFVTALSWGRYVEILILMCGAALPMAFLPLEHEGRRIIITYFKYFISIVLQGFVIVISMMICTFLSRSITLNLAPNPTGIISFFAILGNSLINAIVLVTTVLKSTQIAQKWVGQ